MFSQQMFHKSNKTTSHIFIRYHYDNAYFCIKYNENIGIRMSHQDENKNRYILTVLETENLLLALNYFFNNIKHEMWWVHSMRELYINNHELVSELVDYKSDVLYTLLDQLIFEETKKPRKQLNIYYTTIRCDKQKSTYIYNYTSWFEKWSPTILFIFVTFTITNIVFEVLYSINFSAGAGSL